MNYTYIFSIILIMLLICTVSPEPKTSESEGIEETINEENINVTNQITASEIGPIITQLLLPLETSIQPYLGPLAPLSSILTQVITNAVTEVVVSLMNETVASAKHQDISNRDYTTYLVNIPKNGRFLLLSKHTEKSQTHFHPIRIDQVKYRGTSQIKHPADGRGHH